MVHKLFRQSTDPHAAADMHVPSSTEKEERHEVAETVSVSFFFSM
jgi:hypothetical protein